MKLQQGKILIGCAMYVDALRAASILSKVLQEEKLDITLCLRSIPKSKKSLKSLTNLMNGMSTKEQPSLNAEVLQRIGTG